MAHSPSPGPAIMASSSAIRHLSGTPPLPQPPLNKRDKKRSQLENRVRDIAAGMAANRDVNLRAQLNALSRDMLFITGANLYLPQRLDDGPNDMMAEVASIRTSGSGETETTRVPLGRNAARFVEQINNAMDHRDSSLQSLVVSPYLTPVQLS